MTPITSQDWSRISCPAETGLNALSKSATYQSNAGYVTQDGVTKASKNCQGTRMMALQLTTAGLKSTVSRRWWSRLQSQRPTKCPQWLSSRGLGKAAKSSRNGGYALIWTGDPIIMRMTRHFKLSIYQQLTGTLVASLSPQSITKHNWCPQNAHSKNEPILYV